MRTPNTKCCICGKPLYRRPFELAKVRYVACMEHRNEAQSLFELTDAQVYALSMGRTSGTNHRTGYKHREESKRKTSESHKKWCAANPDKVKARGAKTRGAMHYNWKGGYSRINTAIRRMTENRKWMDAVVRRDCRCSRCGAETDLEAHHIKPLSEIIKDNNITGTTSARYCSELWDISNGITLCEKCHCEHHGRKYTAIGNGRRKMPLRGRASVAGKLNPNYRGGTVPLVCPQCGKVFQVKQSEVGKRKCCSRRCLGESQRKNV